jgi:Rrf2 family iron-sulfur cluster assembly transcriptional regulator
MLSRTSHYALRALYHISRRDGSVPVLASEIASDMEIPQRYLSGILSTLVQRGILTSTRGKHGGFKLARQPKDILLHEILAPFETGGQRTGCPFGNAECGIRNPCPIHDRWSVVVQAYEKFVQTTTLAMLHIEEPSRKPTKRPI